MRTSTSMMMTLTMMMYRYRAGTSHHSGMTWKVKIVTSYDGLKNIVNWQICLTLIHRCLLKDLYRKYWTKYEKAYCTIFRFHQNTQILSAIKKNMIAKITIGVIYFRNQNASLRFFAPFLNYSYTYVNSICLTYIFGAVPQISRIVYNFIQVVISI